LDKAGSFGGEAKGLFADAASEIDSLKKGAEVDSMAGAPMRSLPEASAEVAKNDSAKRPGAAPAPELPAPTNFAISGTAMAPPQVQTQPAIDQVWLLEVNERYSQDQLLQALTSNSISVPAELKKSPAVTLNDKKENTQSIDVGGIHVAAKPLQMKNALSQLSQSDAVTISAFQLGAKRTEQTTAGESSAAPSDPDAPPSVMSPQKAIAQKLRGNYFDRQSITQPSSLVPKTYDDLENKIGVRSRSTEDLEDRAEEADDDSFIGDTIPEAPVHQLSEMEQLFPGSSLESDRLQNFLILIRNKK